MTAETLNPSSAAEPPTIPAQKLAPDSEHPKTPPTGTRATSHASPKPVATSSTPGCSMAADPQLVVVAQSASGCQIWRAPRLLEEHVATELNESDKGTRAADSWGQATFRTTRWSVVARAGQADDPGSLEALEQLCREYWYPVYSFVRRSGNKPPEAEDLVQGFFAKLLEKNYVAEADRERGRFRTFLLASVKHYLANESRRAAAQKRGGGVELLPMETDEAEERFSREPATNESPEQLFERRWAETVLENSLRRVRLELDGGGKVKRFEYLKPFLLRQKEASYREAADKLGLTEAAVKSAIFRMRERFQQIFREEIGHTVVTTEEIDAEIRHLFQVLAR